MSAGYALGPLFLQPTQRRRPIRFASGLGAIAAFIVLRSLNIHGDPGPWTVQVNFVYSVMSFLNCQKYPPSLLFLLMTLGVALLALAVFDHGLGRVLAHHGRLALLSEPLVLGPGNQAGIAFASFLIQA